MKKLTTVEIAELEATIQKLRSKANSLAKQLDEPDSESHLTLKEKMQIKAEIQGLRAEANKLKKQIENSEKELDETAEAAKKAAEEEAAAKKAAEEAAAKKAAEEAAAKKAAEEAAAKKAAEVAAAKKAAEEAANNKAAEKAANNKAAEEEKTQVSKDKKSIWLVILGIAVVLCLIIILVMVLIPNKESNQGLGENNSIVTDESQDESDFDISKFNAICVNLGKYSTDEEDIVGNVYKTTENIGTKKLAELTKKYGETNVANTIVNIIVGGSGAMRDAKVAKEGWQYNPNAAEEYYNTYMDICDAYEIKLGKNPTVVLENIAAYKANPGNRSAIEEEIRSTGDLDLLKWYQDNAAASDLLNKQSRDTQLADQYKENVEDKLIESESFISILEKVLQKQKTGDFAVIENNEYSKEFKDYIAIEIATVVGAAK